MSSLDLPFLRTGTLTVPTSDEVRTALIIFMLRYARSYDREADDEGKPIRSPERAIFGDELYLTSVISLPNLASGICGFSGTPRSSWAPEQAAKFQIVLAMLRREAWRLKEKAGAFRFNAHAADHAPHMLDDEDEPIDSLKPTRRGLYYFEDLLEANPQWRRYLTHEAIKQDIALR